MFADSLLATIGDDDGVDGLIDGGGGRVGTIDARCSVANDAAGTGTGETGRSMLVRVQGKCLVCICEYSKRDDWSVYCNRLCENSTVNLRLGE